MMKLFILTLKFFSPLILILFLLYSKGKSQNCTISISPLSQDICPGSSAVLNTSITLNNNICQKSDLPLNLQSGLAAWYPFCGNANDLSGNGNHGTVIGASLAPDRFGNPNMAYYFDGMSNSIVIQNSASLNVDSLTIIAFVRPDPGLNEAIILAKSDSNNATNYSYHFNYEASWAGNQGICAAWGDGNCSPPSSINASVVFGPQGLFNSNLWNMTGMTIDATGYSEIFLDTTVVGSGSTGIPLISCNSPLSTVRIGGVWWPGHPQRFKGYIDDIYIYNRPLSQAEIKQLYHLYSGVNIPVSYLWSTGATTSSIIVSPGTTTTYTVTAITPNSSCSTQAVVNIIPLPLTISGPITANGNQLAQYNTPAYSGYNYTWSVQNGMILSGQGTSSIQVQWNNITGAGIVKLVFCNDSSQVVIRIDSLQYPLHCLKRNLPPNLQNGLNAYYPFCGDATDQSGNGNHGMPYGLQLVQDRFGNSASAYYFNGMGDHIVAPNSSTLSIDSGTFVAFLTPDPATSDGLIFAKSDSMDATDYNYHLVHETFWQGNNGFFGAWGDGNCNIPSSINANYIFAPNLLSSANWQMVAVTVDATGKSNLYRNGILVTTVNSGSPMGSCNNVNSTLRIGGPWWVGYPDWFQGIIDDIFIYNRVLDSSEVVQLYTLPVSSQTDITEQTLQPFSVFPNPFSSDLTLRVSENAKVAFLRILNYEGKILKLVQVESKTLQLEGEVFGNTGLYLIQAVSGEGEILHQVKVVRD